MIQNLINHVALAVDASSSVQGQPIVPVFDGQLARLKQRSVELNQETRISIYTFASEVKCLAFDMDVMRFDSLANHYRAYGQTALCAAALQAIEDHKKLPELYGDHAFLLTVFTDGEENSSGETARRDLPRKIASLPDNWTVACMVPNAGGVYEAKKFGFPAESCGIWDVNSSTGLESAVRTYTTAIDNYMTARAVGVRSTKNFFTLDPSALSTSSPALIPLSARQYAQYQVRRINAKQYIKGFVESWSGEPYRMGSAYYQPTKKVKIQDHKVILVQRINTGQVYEGVHLRQLLGIPPQTVEVEPASNPDWRVFVQSTSVNRLLIPGTFVLVRK